MTRPAELDSTSQDTAVDDRPPLEPVAEYRNRLVLGSETPSCLLIGPNRRRPSSRDTPEGGGVRTSRRPWIPASGACGSDCRAAPPARFPACPSAERATNARASSATVVRWVLRVVALVIALPLLPWESACWSPRSRTRSAAIRTTPFRAPSERVGLALSVAGPSASPRAGRRAHRLGHRGPTARRPHLPPSARLDPAHRARPRCFASPRPAPVAGPGHRRRRCRHSRRRPIRLRRCAFAARAYRGQPRIRRGAVTAVRAGIPGSSRKSSPTAGRGWRAGRDAQLPVRGPHRCGHRPSLRRAAGSRAAQLEAMVEASLSSPVIRLDRIQRTACAQGRRRARYPAG